MLSRGHPFHVRAIGCDEPGDIRAVSRTAVLVCLEQSCSAAYEISCEVNLG